MYTCFSGCSYPGATINPSRWGSAEFCKFYEHSGCNADAVSAYSCVPDCLQDCGGPFCETFAKLSDACDKNTGALNFTQIQRLEDKCLDSFASSETTLTQLAFELSIEYDGFNASEFAVDAGAQTATVNTISSTMKKVKSSNVVIINVTSGTDTGDNRRSLFSFQSTVVTYRVDVLIEVLGYKSSQTSPAYASLTKSVQDAFNSKRVLATLRRVGSPVYRTALFDPMEFNTGSIAVSKAVTTVVKSAAPSFVPTVSPSLSPTVSPTLVVENVVTVTSAIVASAVLFCCCFVFLLYICCRSRNQSGRKYVKNKVAVDMDNKQDHCELDEFVIDSAMAADNYQLGSALEGSTVSDDEKELGREVSDEDFVPDLIIKKPAFDVNAPLSWDDTNLSSSRILLPPLEAMVLSLIHI